ncbi:methyltransferase domain-containing protein [Vibrio sp. Of14-4]|uniref:class I SAM-dependent methyltransferase n=1 Tax=Vibrio sp. Of14-4 TaxID=2724878 RepID=UPI001EF2DAED|nr:methyltransferase domain-containing protein [Vibrio sp. Of14-4]MCG7489660.1 methyltransferase domain-containing protein [Vibrio sp. Of14-4]
MKKLHIGAGSDIKPGWINHDVAALEGIDIVHDLGNYPWPWQDSSIDEIFMKDVLEHLPDTIKVMEELHRICKPGAKIYIAVPFWNSYEAITDPTHTSQFNEFTFDFFDPSKDRCKNRPYYTSARFKIKKIGFGVSFLRPYLQIRLLSRYFVIYNPIGKWVLGFMASLLNNIITGLEIHLEK